MKSILQNFWLKIIALLMGFLVWLHVATEKTYRQQISLPLTGIEMQDSLTLLSKPPDSLLVEVSASGKQLMRRQWRDRGVRVIATEFGVGLHSVEISPNNTALAGQANNITLEEIVFPREIRLEIDRTSSTIIEVVPDIDARADNGYAVAGIYVRRPERITLTGPATQISGVGQLSTGHKELSSLRNSVEVMLPIVLPEGFGYRVYPDSVLVVIDIVPVKTRIYEDLPIVIYNTPVGETLTTVPASIEIEVTGPPEDIDLLHRTTLTVSLDYRLVSPDGFAHLKVDCPSNFQVKAISSDSVRIVTQSNDSTRN